MEYSCADLAIEALSNIKMRLITRCLFTLFSTILFVGCGSTNNPMAKEFSEPGNTSVFTTKFIIEDKNDITYVSHDLEDGAWQFMSNDEFENYESIAKIVGLQQIVEIDSTILKIADLPLGYIATRPNKLTQWTIIKQD